VPVSADDLAFVDDNHSAAMVTMGADGRPKVARVGVALVDGVLWSSGTPARRRTDRLRVDPRCTLYVHDSGYSWVALETNVTIVEGPDLPTQSLRLFRVMQDRPSGPLLWNGVEVDEAAFLVAMREEQRLIYEFEITKSYGLH
jgi:uncharacterized pyridoxamine 5'-phosphate oxidase family protein